LRRRNRGRASSGTFEFILRWCVFKFATFWYHNYGRSSRRKKVVAKKPAKKLRGLTWNRMNTPCSICENDQHKKLNILSDFDDQTPTHIDATHAISKSERKFQNRIPKGLDQKFYIAGISMIHWIRFNNRISEIIRNKKVMAILSPGIQPKHNARIYPRLTKAYIM